MKANDSERPLTFLEKNLFGVAVSDLPGLLPGILAVALLTWAGLMLSEFIGIRIMGFEKSPVSAVMLVIVIGFVLGLFIRMPKLLSSGLRFSIKKVLRLGIMLLGIRLTFFDVLKLGAYGVPIVAICILGALLITTWINNRLRLPERLGTLIAVGTSICGVTAIVAAAPAIDADEEETAYAVTVITIFGLFATLFYPYLADAIFSGDAIQAGLFLGTSVHETAQVVGAGQIYADVFSRPLALDVAAVTKLVRNVFMALVIPAMALYYARRTQGDGSQAQKTGFAKLFPLFILGFLAMAVFRSAGDAGVLAGGKAYGILDGAAWTALIKSIKHVAEILLVAALAGVGLNTNFRSFRALGVKPFLVGLGASASVGVISIIAIQLLGRFVVF